MPQSDHLIQLMRGKLNPAQREQRQYHSEIQRSVEKHLLCLVVPLLVVLERVNFAHLADRARN
jgi:hypothetical protein